MICKNPTCNRDIREESVDVVQSQFNEDGSALDLIIECPDCEERYYTFIAGSDFYPLNEELEAS